MKLNKIFILQTNVNPMLLDAAPFQVRPAIFELANKETAMIEIIFRPSELGDSSHDILMLCDNCHMKKITITGKK